MGSMLEVKDLKKKNGDFAAVKGITFDIEEGEIISLLGPNGAGKTTTISMLSTLYTPTAGGKACRPSARVRSCRSTCPGRPYGVISIL